MTGTPVFPPGGNPGALFAPRPLFPVMPLISRPPPSSVMRPGSASSNHCEFDFLIIMQIPRERGGGMRG